METPQQKTMPDTFPGFAIQAEKLRQADRDYAVLIGTVEMLFTDIKDLEAATGLSIPLPTLRKLAKLTQAYRDKQVQELPFS